MKKIRMVVANTKPDPTGCLPQLTPKALREATKSGSVPLLLNFDYDRELGVVTNFMYDEEQEELIAEAVIYPSAEIPEDFLPALGYIWDPKTKSFLGATSVGLALEPAKPGTRLECAEDN